MSSDDPTTIRRYLLQQLAEEERERVEERIMTDDAFFEEVTFVEDELVDEYTRGSLTGAERDKFVRSFLKTPQGQQAVNFSKAFRAHLQKSAMAATPKRAHAPGAMAFLPSQRVTAAVALTMTLLVVSLTVGLFVFERDRRSETERLQAEVQRMERELADQRALASQLQRDFQETQDRNADLEKQLADVENAPDHSRQSGSVAGLLSLILSSGLDRGPGTARPTVTITRDTNMVEFRLKVANPDNARYTVELSGGGGLIRYNDIKSRLVRSGPQVVFRVPSDKLPAGDHEIQLFGDGKILDSYYFTVATK